MNKFEFRRFTPQKKIPIFRRLVQQWVFYQAEKKLTSLPVLRYHSGHRKRWFKNPIQSGELAIVEGPGKLTFPMKHYDRDIFT